MVVAKQPPDPMMVRAALKECLIHLQTQSRLLSASASYHFQAAVYRGRPHIVRSFYPTHRYGGEPNHATRIAKGSSRDLEPFGKPDLP